MSTEESGVYLDASLSRRLRDAAAGREVTVDQVVINDQAIRAQAERLTATGWDGDSYRFVESLLLDAVAAGWKRIEPVPGLRGPASTVAGREKAMSIWEAAKREKAL